MDGSSFYLPGGFRATKAEEVLEVMEGWALGMAAASLIS
jgi:Mor family transcriptional regulator